MKRWKKLLASVLSMALMLACVSVYGLEVKAAEESVSGDFKYTWNEDGESVTITKYTGNGGDVEIPSEISGGG